MTRLMLLAAGAAALSLAACDRTTRTETTADADKGEALRTISRLDCPEQQGDLKLVTAATDGRTCAYEAPDAEVTLRLVALENGNASAALKQIEAELQGVIPPPKKDAEAAADTDAGKGGETEINFPGLHIKADDEGADVRIGSIKVDADDEGAKVRVGETTIVNANDDGAEIRTGKSGAGGVRGTYILASDKGADGYHVVGYEARGPKDGPIVVAVVKSKADGRDEHDLFDDMKDLVKRNVGG